uniref:TATA-box binding protein n=1 Tax=viral metagenome TaxID=1070528 RepID=A0A6C0BUA0_9ZZZZ
MDLEDEWATFFENSDNINNIDENENENVEDTRDMEVPKSTDIYISTKTKICYLNQNIDLFDVFWKLELVQYYKNEEGIIKKQMKFNSLDKNTYENTLKYIEKEKANNYVEETLIQHVDTISGSKIKFKDIRKISIGISKKDILSYRSKPKSAFYNCFVILIRLNHNGEYKEIHIKIFNTGKVEIPGIQDESIFKRSLDYIRNIMSTFYPDISFIPNKIETVLINSNFSCGYLINREKLFIKLKNKYKINASYDPCSYPGIQCKYKVTHNEINYELSFMVFRTGSILIVGKCNEDVLYIVYEFLKKVLTDEYQEIKQYGANLPEKTKNKNKKVRKKKITVTSVI